MSAHPIRRPPTSVDPRRIAPPADVFLDFREVITTSILHVAAGITPHARLAIDGHGVNSEERRMEGRDPDLTAIYRSETKRVPAEIVLATGSVLSGALHLQLNTLRPAGFETTEELLNRPDAFYAVSLETEQVVLLSKGQTAVVVCTAQRTEPEPESLTGAIGAVLDIELTSGTTYRGTARWQLPPPKCRTLDYLNSSGGFLKLVGETETWYINRAHVRAVYPVD